MTMMIFDPEQPYVIQQVQFEGDTVIVSYLDPTRQTRHVQKFETCVFQPADHDEGVRTRVRELGLDICALIDEVEHGE